VRAVAAVVLVAALGAASGCRSGTSPPGKGETQTEKTAAPSASVVPTVAPVPSSAACDSLDRAECLRALHCTLHHVKPGQYECLPSSGPCETNLLEGDRAGCEARAGCTWDPGGCYCPFPGYGQTQVPDKEARGGGACACGGGPPPSCKQAK
jgi:hypothetical protein